MHITSILRQIHYIHQISFLSKINIHIFHGMYKLSRRHAVVIRHIWMTSCTDACTETYLLTFWTLRSRITPTRKPLNPNHTLTSLSRGHAQCNFKAFCIFLNHTQHRISIFWQSKQRLKTHRYSWVSWYTLQSEIIKKNLKLFTIIGDKSRDISLWKRWIEWKYYMENLRDLPLAQMVPRKNSYCLTYIQNFHTLYIFLIHLT